MADDDDSVRSVLASILRRYGNDVNEAEDGEVAVAQCCATRPDLAFIDMYMPGKDGIETIRELRKEVPEVKVIAMSGEQLEGGLDVLQMASMLGAAGILRKPFEIDEVTALVAKALEGSGEEPAS